MEYNYCQVLDFTSARVYCIDLTNPIKPLSAYDNLDDLISDYGLNPNNCQYMFVEEDLDVIHINQPIK